MKKDTRFIPGTFSGLAIKTGREAKEVHESFTYAEYAIEKFFAGEPNWVTHIDYGLESSSNKYISEFLFHRINGKMRTVVDRDVVDNAITSLSGGGGPTGMRFEIEMRQLGCK
jgi:hypothetical protein